ncbi:hypothetical protein [Caballeronia sp. BR00000012568055]|uniref:hypothetical protein n=1 Tax=Caballeronia sp. BR00000012568055 TaxID=2918761 RepID=UPI0023F8B67E|nr:hypothetical protein [Caballeronia sp. BR00000012568055]
MKLIVLLSLALLASFAIHAQAEQGDAEDRALLEQYVAQQRAPAPAPTPTKVATTKEDKAPTAASAP